MWTKFGRNLVEHGRLILFMAIAMCLLLLWQAWQQDYQPQVDRAQPVQSTFSEDHSADVPVGIGSTDSGEHLISGQVMQASQEAGSAIPTEAFAVSGVPFVHIQTDLIDGRISTQGGTLTQMVLLKVKDDLENGKPYVLLDARENSLYVVQSGLLSPDNEGDAAPTHHDHYQAMQSEYRLGPNDQTLEVPLLWEDGQGHAVKKIFIFSRGSYQIQLRYEIKNGEQEPWRVRQYAQIRRSEKDLHERRPGQRFVRNFAGASVFTDQYKKFKFKQLAKEPLDLQYPSGWVAMVEHYFISAVIPPQNEGNANYHFYTKPLHDGTYLAGFSGSLIQLGPGETTSLNTSFYVGPKARNKLAEAAEGLERSVDYGWLTVIAEPLFWLLTHIHNVVGNWGVAVIFLTFLLKAAFYKLSETQFKSMAKMKEVTPRIQSLRERYADDREALQKAMMELYRKEKFNPLGGCLPILAQMPVFIALYWVLIGSVELRHAGFALWIHDLSAPDPLFILPALYGMAMFLQQRMSGTAATMDPVQARVMQFMPVGMAVFFAFFPSGLVLYWLTNSVLSLVQQWYITSKITRQSQMKKA